jgi:ketosteroid isomerase-like protein
MEVVQRAYAAFGQGDVPGVLELLTEDVIWRFHAGGDIPYGGTYIGKAKVQEWFSKLASSTDIQQFEPREFLAGPTHVTVIGWERSKPLPDGKVYESDWVHVFTVKDDKIARYIGTEDTAVRSAAQGNGA